MAVFATLWPSTCRCCYAAMVCKIRETGDLGKRSENLERRGVVNRVCVHRVKYPILDILRRIYR